MVVLFAVSDNDWSVDFLLQTNVVVGGSVVDRCEIISEGDKDGLLIANIKLIAFLPNAQGHADRPTVYYQ